ncbi:hypothetical protein Cgig2_032068 [Carnegiea gigantea]|uniref:AB hydrolase-1 domain-containing protein n=1 Tax=Carnegiea gigantea TaxID=171969 RepID=A0A9Q1Q9F0_9CARY|nr:hypothetical protein Cgig2_032068 [Carnegiea gigantea]
MKGLVLQCNFHQLNLGSPHKSNSLHDSSGIPRKRFTFQNGLGNCWRNGKGKPRKKFATTLVVRAASSSSPSLGASASDYPGEVSFFYNKLQLKTSFLGNLKIEELPFMLLKLFILTRGTLVGEPVKKKRCIAGIDQDELMDPRQLADADSLFCEFKGVDIHYKLCEPEPESPIMLAGEVSSQAGAQTRKIGLPVILLHGFGASAFSWHRVMKPFAQITGSKVLAFDRPAFGLTSRVRHSGDKMPLNPYSMAFSVLATLYFIDFLAAEKAVLVGCESAYLTHSAGSLTAVDAYFEAPHRVAALILVAPAILAPLSAPKVANQNQTDKEKRNKESNSDSSRRPNLFSRIGEILTKFYRYVVSAFVQMWRGMLDMANSLYKKALAAFLHSAVGVMLVRVIIDKFGIAAVKNAWYDAKQVTDHILQGYTKPLRIKDWDRALVEYTVAMLTDTQAKLKPPLEKRLQEIACPGDSDRLVPAWNSQRLSRAIPGSQLEIIKNCGHLPQEEKPEEFVSIVAQFLRRTFVGSEELCLQA